MLWLCVACVSWEWTYPTLIKRPTEQKWCCWRGPRLAVRLYVQSPPGLCFRCRWQESLCQGMANVGGGIKQRKGKDVKGEQPCGHPGEEFSEESWEPYMCQQGPTTELHPPPPSGAFTGLSRRVEAAGVQASVTWPDFEGTACDLCMEAVGGRSRKRTLLKHSGKWMKGAVWTRGKGVNSGCVWREVWWWAGHREWKTVESFG